MSGWRPGQRSAAVSGWALVLVAAGCPDPVSAPQCPPNCPVATTPSVPTASLQPAPTAPPNPVTREGGCDVDTDCVLFSAGCCGPCMSTPPRSVLRSEAPQMREDCRRMRIRCKPCERPGFAPELAAGCQQGTCTVVDLRTTSITACTRDADCYLRPSSCCGCATDPVSIAKAGAQLYQAMVCEPGIACAPCEIPVYRGVTARCHAGHCSAEGFWKR